MNDSHGMQVVCHHEYGKPDEVVRAERWELPPLGAGDVRVRMRAAPVNPADLNMLEGAYPVRPELPAVLGIEGVGVVEETGRDVTGLDAGQTVLVARQPGAWCEARVVDAEFAVPIPDDIDVEQAAMLAVNPPTALRMIEDFVELEPGDWIVQNAANSGVGRSVIQIARHRGFKTLNIVRREDLVDDLKNAGADEVVVYEPKISKAFGDLTGGAGIRLGLNTVGGDNAREIAKGLAEGGTLVTYGAMAREPLRIPNGLLIFKDIQFRGFWITRWHKLASCDAVRQMFDTLIPMARDGALHVPVAQRYRLTDARDAIRHAQQERRGGKVLFRMD